MSIRVYALRFCVIKVYEMRSRGRSGRLSNAFIAALAGKAVIHSCIEGEGEAMVEKTILGFLQKDEIGRQASVLWGFAFFSAWNFITIHDVFRFSGDAVKMQPSLVWSIASPLAIGLAMVVIGLRWQPITKLLARKSVVVVLSLLTLAGSIAMVSMGRGDELRSFAGLGTQVLFEILLLLWLKAFTNFDLEIIIMKIPAILALSGLAVGLLLLVPAIVRLPALAILAVLQMGFLLYSEARVAPAPEHVSSASRLALEKTLIPAVVFFVFVCVLLSLARFNSRDHLPVVFYYFFLLEIGFVLFGVSGLLTFASYRNRMRYSRSFSLEPAFALAACAVLLAVTPFAFNAERVYSCIGLTAYNVAFIIVFLLLGKHFSCSSVQLFAFGRALYSLVSVVSNFITIQFIDPSNPFSVDVATFILIIACQGVVVVFFVAFAIARKEGALSFMGLPVAAQGPEEGATVAAPAPISRHDAIDTIVARYALSEREAEVLEMLAKGRTIKRTSEELYISIGTVNTYIRRIYQKLNVHSRQELLDQLERQQ